MCHVTNTDVFTDFELVTDEKLGPRLERTIASTVLSTLFFLIHFRQPKPVSVPAVNAN